MQLNKQYFLILPTYNLVKITTYVPFSYKCYYFIYKYYNI